MTVGQGRGLMVSRQLDLEDGTHPHLGLDIDGTAVEIDRAQRQRQTQPVAAFQEKLKKNRKSEIEKKIRK